MSDSQKSNLRVFYTIIITQLFSIIGSRVSGLALGIWVFNQTGDATPLTLVAFFAIFPQVLLSSVAGVLADRWDRRYVMALADIGQAVCTLVLLLLFASTGFELWHLYTLTFVSALFGVFQSPAFSASVTMLVPDDQRDRANAMMQIIGPAAGIVAPAIAGVIFSIGGVTGAIGFDLVTFVVAFVTILLIRIPRPRKTQAGSAFSGSFWQEMSSGLRFLWSRQVMFWVVMCLMGLNFIFNVVGVLMTPYLLARVESETTYGIILSLFNSGMLVGGIIIGVWGGTRPRVHTIFPAAMAMGILMACFGIAQTPVALGIIGFLMLLPNAFANTLFMSIMQAKTPPDLQGRVFAVIGQIAMLATPLAYLLSGPLADQVFEPMVTQPIWSTFASWVGAGTGSGMGLMFVISGIAALALTGAMYAHPAVRAMEATLPDYTIEPAPQEESIIVEGAIA